MPLIWITCAFMGGLVAADHFLWQAAIWSWLLVLSTVVLFGWRLILQWISVDQALTRSITLSLVCLLAFSFAGARYGWSLHDLSDPRNIAYRADWEVELVITGEVSDFPDERDDYTLLEVETQSLRLSTSILHTNVEACY